MQSIKSISKNELIAIINELCTDDPRKLNNIGTLFELRTLEHPDTIHSVIILNTNSDIL